MGSSSSDTPHYENVPFEVPEGWCWCRLEELFLFIRNGKSIKQVKGAGGFPITRIETISNSIIDRERMGYADITETEGLEEYILRNGDILMSHINSPIHVGKSALCYDISEDEVILHGMNLLCLRPHSGIDPFYLNLFFTSPIFRELIRPYIKNAVNQASINTQNIGNTYIPVPPLAEQIRISKMYESVNSYINNLTLSLEGLTSSICSVKSKILDLAIHGKLVPQDANDEPASELLKRINPKAVASCDNPHCLYIFPIYWELVKLEDVCEFIRNGVSIRQIKGANGIPITRIETISNGIVDRDRMGYADIIDDTYEKYYLQHGDILMSHINSPIHVGKSALYESIEGEKIIHGMNLLCLRMKTGICPKYMNYLFMSEIFKDEIRPYIKNAVNQASINTRNLGGVYSPIPPYNEQQRIVTKIEELFAVLDEIQKSIEA